ncbi:MAG: LysM peptidoglycan-binding domain-containing protein [Flavobacteriaceae bacterium]|nr:LysM peptidoglycan-binding domain-containing protein [Flavobacteriaceae bacterium]
MKHLLILASLFFIVTGFSSEGLAQDRYRSHQVLAGETVYSIAQKYKIPEAEIYRLNPDARKGIGLGSILIIPSEMIIQSGSEPVDFKRHKVRRKETLFSISQKYNITVDDIKKYNKHLYSKGLKKGEKLQIPIFPKVESTATVVTNNETNNAKAESQTHIIQAKETKYGIARKYGITIAELEAMNPDVPANFPIGSILNVPNNSVTESATIEESTFDFYEVQPKEGFFRLKVKLGLTEEEIVALNPYAKDGLKAGMILKIPKESATGLDTGRVNKINLEERINDRSRKRVAVLLPFQLRKMDRDSLELNEDLIKDNRTLRIALDFYSGVLMAAEFAKDKGISLELNAFDTEGSSNTTAGILAGNNFESMDAVIGPLLSKNVERAAGILKSDNVPVFSPLSNRNIKLTSNLFQTLPKDELLETSMIDYLKENAGDRSVLLISDNTKARQKAAIMAALPAAKTLSPREKGFLYVVDIEQKIDKTRENWVILESDDPVIISNVVGLLNGMPATYGIRLFTTDKNDSYDYHDISNVHLANLQFTFPSISKSYDYNEKNAFLTSYKNKFGVLPNRFAVRGFDVTYDVILRLASEGNVYDAIDSDLETEYIENKFRYQKKMFSGYSNQAFYILKYNEDLRFEVVK